MSQFKSHEIGTYVPSDRIKDYTAKIKHLEQTLHKHGFDDQRGIGQVARTLVLHGIHDLVHLFEFDREVKSVITGFKHIAEKRAEMVVSAASSYVRSHKFEPEHLSDSIRYRYLTEQKEGDAREEGSTPNTEQPPWNQSRSNEESTDEKEPGSGERSSNEDETASNNPGHRSPLNFILDVVELISEGDTPEEAITDALIQEAHARDGTGNDTGFWRVMRTWGTRGVQDQAEEVAELLNNLTREVGREPAERPSHRVNIQMSVSSMAETLDTSEEHLRSLVRARQHFGGYPLPDWALFDQTGQVEYFHVPMEGFLYDPDRY